jgi:MFS family permease
VLFAIGAVSTLFWLTAGGHRFAWLSPASGMILATAVISLALLAWNERRQSSPFLPLDLLQDRTIRLSAALVLMFASCMFSIIFFLPIYLQLGHHVSPHVSGLLLLPVTAGQVTAAMLAAKIMRRTGEPHPIPVIGMSLTSAGLLMLGLLPPDMSLIIALGFLSGVGLGCVMPVNQVVVQTVAGRSKLGRATATISLARSTGGAAGAALFGAVVFAVIPAIDRSMILQQVNAIGAERIVHAFHRAFLCAAGVAALAAFTASRIPRITLWPGKEPKSTAS